MGQIFCSACGKQIDSGAAFCSYCGAKVVRHIGGQPACPPAGCGKVTVLGYKEPFAVSPSVGIYKDGVKIASVARCSQVQLDIQEPCTLVFKLGIRSASCRVYPNDNVLLSCNRVTGSLKATRSDAANTESLIRKSKSNDKIAILISVLIVLALLMFSYFCDDLIAQM